MAGVLTYGSGIVIGVACMSGWYVYPECILLGHVLFLVSSRCGIIEAWEGHFGGQ
jgi:hypothetical protein